MLLAFAFSACHRPPAFAACCLLPAACRSHKPPAKRRTLTVVWAAAMALAVFTVAGAASLGHIDTRPTTQSTSPLATDGIDTSVLPHPSGTTRAQCLDSTDTESRHRSPQVRAQRWVAGAAGDVIQPVRPWSTSSYTGQRRNG